jgi:superfamily II DNA or RNA helicase
MINELCECPIRTRFIVDHIEPLLVQKRKILVLSDRRGHLEAISRLLKTTVRWGFYYGGMNQDALKRSESCDVILGTFQMAQEGLDIRGLNTLILASPKSDVVQATGRILRDKPSERTHIPLIMDIVDDFSIFSNQSKKRMTYYKKEGYVPNNHDLETGNDPKQSSITKFCFRVK